MGNNNFQYRSVLLVPANLTLVSCYSVSRRQLECVQP